MLQLSILCVNYLVLKNCVQTALHLSLSGKIENLDKSSSWSVDSFLVGLEISESIDDTQFAPEYQLLHQTLKLDFGTGISLKTWYLLPSSEAQVFEFELYIKTPLQCQVSLIKIDHRWPSAIWLLIHPLKALLYQLLIASQFASLLLKSKAVILLLQQRDQRSLLVLQRFDLILELLIFCSLRAVQFR